MSLLGIIIEKSLSSARLEDKALGYVEGSQDERLLKELGILVLEKGSWKLKQKGEEVAEFLNWIASGKPKGTLPALAKRILCLKREKLIRGIKDAGSATYARSVENKYVAEIDAIFANAGSAVECVVDIQPCNTPTANKNGPGAGTGAGATTVSNAGSGAGSGANNNNNNSGSVNLGSSTARDPLPGGSGSTISASAPKPTIHVEPLGHAPTPARPGMPTPSVQQKDPKVPVPGAPVIPKPVEPANPGVPVDPGSATVDTGLPAGPGAGEPEAGTGAPVVPGTGALIVPEAGGPGEPRAEEPDVPGKKPTIAVRTEDADAKKMFNAILLPTLITLLKRTKDERLHTLLVQILALILERQSEPGFAKLEAEIATLLQTPKEDRQIIIELGRLLGIEQRDDAVEANDPRNPDLVGRITEVVEKQLASRRYSCSDKIQCLQQLVYTTCGEASLLDPLIDHLQKLLAAFGSLPVKNSRVTGLQDSLTRLEELIKQEARNSAMNTNRSSLKTQLSGLESQLESLNSPPNSPFTGKTADMEATAQERTKRRGALVAEIQKVKDLLSAQDDPEARRAMVRSQLFEEQELLDALLRILPDSDPFLPVAEGFKSDILAQIRGVETASLRTLEGSCNSRSHTYRQQVLIAKEEIERLKEEELARQKAQFIQERSTIVEEKDGVIKGLEERLAKLETQREEEYTGKAEELKKLQGEKLRLEDSLRSVTERVENAVRGRTNAESKVSTLEATIASLKAQLEKMNDPTPPPATRNETTRNDVAPLPATRNEATVNNPTPLVSNNAPVLPPVPLVVPPSAPTTTVKPGSVANRIRALQGAQAPKFVTHRGPGFRGGSKKARRGEKTGHTTRKFRK